MIKAILLAAGQSKRLKGENKLVKIYRNKPLINHILNSLHKSIRWSQFNKTQTGSFQYTMLLGYSISQNTGGFMEFASESDQELRDIYLKYRDKLYDRNIKRPSGWNLQEGTIFRAFEPFSIKCCFSGFRTICL